MAFGLARYDLTEITKRIALPELSPDQTRVLTLIVRYAGPGNRDWETAMFRMAAAQKEVATADPPAPKDEATSIREQAEMFASVLVGWEHVYDDEQPDPQQPVVFSTEAAQRFLVEMMTRVWDVYASRFLAFVRKLENFRPPVIDASALGKG